MLQGKCVIKKDVRLLVNKSIANQKIESKVELPKSIQAPVEKI